MQVVPFALDHFDQIEWQTAQTRGQDLYQREWAEEIAQSSDAWTGIAADGYIIACAGVIPTRLLRVGNGPDQPHESLAWAIFSPRLAYHVKDVYREIRGFLASRPEYRIEAYVDADHNRAAPFLEHLGFTYERDIGDVAGDGRPLKLYARVKV